MKYHDSYLDAQEKLRRALKLLDHHGLAYNPVNYAVAYEFVSGKNSDLVASLENIIATNDVNPYALEMLHREFLDRRGEQDNHGVYKLSDSIDRICSVSQDSAGSVDQLEEGIKTLLQQNPTAAVIGSITSMMGDLKKSQAELSRYAQVAQQHAQQIKEELAAARMEALTDPLTQLLNRHALKKKFDSYVNQASKEQINAAIVDIDHFKQFNDDYGHLIGDVILRRMAKLMREMTESMGEVFRYGGEEFLLLIPDVELSTAYTLAEEMRSKVEKLRFISAKTKQRLPRLTISVGVSEYIDGEGMESLIERADEAMYRAKNAGRNQVQVAVVSDMSSSAPIPNSSGAPA